MLKKEEVVNIKKSTKKEDENIYDKEYIYELLEEDEISIEEAGFMEGYL